MDSKTYKGSFAEDAPPGGLYISGASAAVRSKLRPLISGGTGAPTPAPGGKGPCGTKAQPFPASQGYRHPMKDRHVSETAHDPGTANRPGDLFRRSCGRVPGARQ